MVGGEPIHCTWRGASGCRRNLGSTVRSAWDWYTCPPESYARGASCRPAADSLLPLLSRFRRWAGSARLPTHEP